MNLMNPPFPDRLKRPPVAEEIAALEAILFTCDGKGQQAKREAFDRLLLLRHDRFVLSAVPDKPGRYAIRRYDFDNPLSGSTVSERLEVQLGAGGAIIHKLYS
jgi:hypothetical protein